MKTHNYFKNIIEENISQELRFKKYRWNKKLLNWGNKSKLLDEWEAQKACTTMYYTEHFIFLASTITACVFISSFVSLVDIPIRITSFATGLKTCAITAVIRKYK